MRKAAVQHSAAAASVAICTLRLAQEPPRTAKG